MELFKTILLLTGQSAPATGSWTNLGLSHEVLYTVYSSGNGTVSLEYQNPFGFTGTNQSNAFYAGVSFYQATGLLTGYSQPAYSNSPMSLVRAIASGNGQYWVSATSQN